MADNNHPLANTAVGRQAKVAVQGVDFSATSSPNSAPSPARAERIEGFVKETAERAEPSGVPRFRFGTEHDSPIVRDSGRVIQAAKGIAGDKAYQAIENQAIIAGRECWDFQGELEKKYAHAPTADPHTPPEKCYGLGDGRVVVITPAEGKRLTELTRYSYESEAARIAYVEKNTDAFGVATADAKVVYLALCDSQPSYEEAKRAQQKPAPAPARPAPGR